MAEIEQIDIEEFAIRLAALATVIDVREVEEYTEAHVPGAILIPLSELAHRVDELPEGDLHIICKSGGRSLKACEHLSLLGRSATNVAGGTLAWIQSGRETLSGLERG
ncbi:MAG TPA: sulfurtransferase [Acidimicrobiaceae bacterium]|jgi:rhodanese-related sulfurtransferase|nr:sulfurtransferase [Acidimicrobiaceae bacterium]